MIFTGKNNILDSREFPILTGEVVGEEGMILVAASENGYEVAKPSTGTADIFLGFSYGQTMTPTVKSIVENLTVPAVADYTVTLAREPIAGQIYIVNSSGTAQTAGDPVNANQYSISGKVITFHSGQAGLVETITYRYLPTAAELLANDRLMLTSVSAADQLMSIGAITQGEVYTNMFDAGDAYALGNAVGMQANGIAGASGANNIPGATVCHVPNAELPYLGIRLK